jgi:DNA polymerase-3 subunit alpha
LVNNTKLGKKKNGSSNLLVDYINYARRMAIPVLSPDINKSGEEFRVEDKSIRFSIGHVKNVAKAASVIESFQPFTGMADFYERVKVNVKDEEEVEVEEDGETPSEENKVEKKKKRKVSARRPSCKVVDSLIASGAFDQFGTRNEMMTEYYKLRKEKELPSDLTEEQWQEKETEVLGICLSRPILYKKYEKEIKDNGWCLVSEIDPVQKKIMVFGEILSIKQHISKAGNSMHIVHITDGIDSTSFFVFQGGWEFFKDNYKQGSIGAIPLARFQDGDGSTRFFDDRGKPFVIKK